MDYRFQRQQLLVPQGMKDCTVLLVGLGMLGSWTAHVLSRTVGRVIAYDFDTVGEENIGTQAYDDLAIGFSKADAMAARLTGLPFTSIEERFSGRPVTGPHIVVSCVDSFASRRFIADYAARHADLFIDTRAAGTVGVVVTCPIHGEEGGEELLTYLRTLESDEDAPAPACGAEGCAMVGMWVASQVASVLTRYFKGLPVPYKVVRDVALDDEILREQAPEVLV